MIENLPKEEARRVVCALAGHSRVVDLCFGQITCTRCSDILGDTLMGGADMSGDVINGHSCKTCQDNAKTLTWRDKELLPNDVLTYLKDLKTLQTT